VCVVSVWRFVRKAMVTAVVGCPANDGSFKGQRTCETENQSHYSRCSKALVSKKPVKAHPETNAGHKVPNEQLNDCKRRNRMRAEVNERINCSQQRYPDQGCINYAFSKNGRTIVIYAQLIHAYCQFSDA
jgi:hypothetical protein